VIGYSKGLFTGNYLDIQGYQEIAEVNYDTYWGDFCGYHHWNTV